MMLTKHTSIKRSETDRISTCTAVEGAASPRSVGWAAGGRSYCQCVGDWPAPPDRCCACGPAICEAG